MNANAIALQSGASGLLGRLQQVNDKIPGYIFQLGEIDPATTTPGVTAVIPC